MPTTKGATPFLVTVSRALWASGDSLSSVMCVLIVRLPSPICFSILSNSVMPEPSSKRAPSSVPHAVALQEQRAVERAGRHRLKIIGAVHVGRAVAVGRADLLERLEKIAGRIFRPVEHQMLEQMRDTDPKSVW